MPSISLDTKIANYVTQLNPKQKKAVLTVVKTFVEETGEGEASWTSPAFIKELDLRIAELESGSVKGRTWEQVKKAARNSMNKNGF
jgi:hypothetical protein